MKIIDTDDNLRHMILQHGDSVSLAEQPLGVYEDEDGAEVMFGESVVLTIDNAEYLAGDSAKSQTLEIIIPKAKLASLIGLLQRGTGQVIM